MKLSSPATALCALLFAGCATAPRAFYLSPDGNDTNPGTLARPFATLPRALRAVREARQQTAHAVPVTVFLRGGTYEIREPIVFTPEDSGSAAAPIVYTAYRNERPVLSGGRRLTGTWRQTPGKPYWQLDVPEARDGKWVFHSLFSSGPSRTRARTPKWGEKVLRADDF